MVSLPVRPDYMPTVQRTWQLYGALWEERFRNGFSFRVDTFQIITGYKPEKNASANSATNKKNLESALGLHPSVELRTKKYIFCVHCRRSKKRQKRKTKRYLFYLRLSTLAVVGGAGFSQFFKQLFHLFYV